MISEEIPILDHGYVKLVDKMGGDLAVVNSARISFGVEHEALQEGDDKLIGYLLRNRHMTPFESSVFTFQIKAPIFVAREHMRHRDSYNEFSQRYKELVNPDFYIPRPENMRSQTGKAGHYEFDNFKGNSKNVAATMDRHNNDALDLYNYYLSQGLAKELARIVLPLSTFTEYIWTVKCRSLMNFLELRNSSDAQWEIQELARTVEELWAEEMPITYEYFRQL